MKKLIIIIGIFLALPVFAASRINFDVNDSIVAGRVTEYKKSGDQSAYLTDHNDLSTSKDGYLINADLSVVEGIPKKYWKIVGGAVVEMMQKEKDDWDAFIEPEDPLDQFNLTADEISLIEAETGLPISDAAAQYGISGIALIIALYAAFKP